MSRSAARGRLAVSLGSSLPAGFKIVPFSPCRYNPRMKWLFKWAFRLVLRAGIARLGTVLQEII